MQFIGVLSLILLYCSALVAQTVSFGGVVIDSSAGQPLQRVHLKLFTINVGGDITNSYGAMSGPDGRFSVTGMPPGTYLILPERTGFVHMMTVSGAVPLRSITLKAGERIN